MYILKNNAETVFQSVSKTLSSTNLLTPPPLALQPFSEDLYDLEVKGQGQSYLKRLRSSVLKIVLTVHNASSSFFSFFL